MRVTIVFDLERFYGTVAAPTMAAFFRGEIDTSTAALRLNKGPREWAEHCRFLLDRASSGRSPEAVVIVDGKPPVGTVRGHMHGEAFCLMRYQCKQCHAIEVIWNIRDGVTPFGVDCRRCGGHDAIHVDWHKDEYRPDHKPQFSERVFRDGTPDEARAYMRQRLDACKGTEYAVTDAEAEEIIERAATSRDGEFQPGWPNLVEVHP